MATKNQSKLRPSSMQAANHDAYLGHWPEAPKGVVVKKVPLLSEQRIWIEQAWSYLDVNKAIELDVDLTNIFGPTGYEKEVNNCIVDFWQRLGVDASYQEMDPSQGNAHRPLQRHRRWAHSAALLPGGHALEGQHRGRRAAVGRPHAA